MTLLEKSYPDLFQKNLETKFITYFLRDYKNYSKTHCITPENIYKKQSIFEKEIFALIKNNIDSLDWLCTDIDGAIPLTYAIYNQVDTISDYLLDNIYDLNTYNQAISQALTASIRMNNLAYFEKIIASEHIDIQYLQDLTVHSIHAAAANPSGLSMYYESISKIHKEKDFYVDVIEKITNLYGSPFKGFEYFLYHNTLDPQDIISIVDNIFERPANRHHPRFEEICLIYNHWKICQFSELLESDLGHKKEIKAFKI